MPDNKKFNKYMISRQKEMEKLLTKDISDIVEQVARDTVKKIKVFIRQYWYNKYTPQNYERTDSLYNSVKYEVDGTDIYIYFDLDSAKRKEGDSESWGSYTDFKDNPSFEGDFWMNMIEYIDTGYFPVGIGSLTNPRLGHGINFIEKTENWLNKYLRNKVNREIEIFIGRKQVF